MSQTSRVQQRAIAPRFVAWFGRLAIESRLVLLLCIIAVALRLFPLAGASTDYDEGVYWQSLRAMSHGQPLFTSIFSSQPPFFLLSLYPLYSFFGLFFGQSLVAARLAVVVYSLIGLIALYFAARSIGGRWTGLLALALLATDPSYLKESYTLQAEVPSLAWQLVALALSAFVMHAKGRTRYLLALGSGIALGLGILTKLFDVFVIIPMLLLLLLPTVNAWAIENRRLRFKGRDTLLAGLRQSLPEIGLLLVGTTLAFIVVLLPYASHLGTVYDQVVRFHLAAGQHAGHSLGYNVKLLASDAIEYPLIALAVVATLFGLRQRAWIIVPPLLWFLASLVFLVRQQPLLDHHRVLLIPPLILLASVIANDLRSIAAPAPSGWNRITTTLPATMLGQFTVVLFVLALVGGLLIGGVGARRDATRPLPQSSVEIASALQAATLPGDLVACDDQYVIGLADHDVPPQLVDTSQVRILSGYLTASQLETIITQSDIRIIVFVSGRFDLIPGFRTWVEANFTQIADFGHGQAMYMKQPQGPQPA